MKRYMIPWTGHLAEKEDGDYVMYSEALAAIEQARREEREACAQIADEAEYLICRYGPDIVAETIRARGDSLLKSQQHMPADIARVMADAGDSLIERGEGK